MGDEKAAWQKQLLATLTQQRFAELQLQQTKSACQRELAAERAQLASQLAEQECSHVASLQQQIQLHEFALSQAAAQHAQAQRIIQENNASVMAQLRSDLLR
jgi:hypothetical protein